MIDRAASGQGTPPGVPMPTIAELRRSTRAAATAALDEFAKVERLVGGAQAHDSFDGILAEHALALEEVRDQLREALDCIQPVYVEHALVRLEQEIAYVRALGSVAATEEEAG